MKAICKPLLLLAGVLTLTALANAADQTNVRFPDGWRKWQHVKTMLIEPGHPLAGLVQGLHHLYANPKAMSGYSKRPFPDGSVIVFDLLEPVAGDKAMTEGPRKALIVMEKNRKRFASTGGWGFEVFGGGNANDRKLAGNAATACFDCHTAQRNRDFVFSDFRP